MAESVSALLRPVTFTAISPKLDLLMAAEEKKVLRAAKLGYRRHEFDDYLGNFRIEALS